MTSGKMDNTYWKKFQAEVTSGAAGNSSMNIHNLNGVMPQQFSSSSPSPSSSSSSSTSEPHHHLINQSHNLNDLTKLHTAFLTNQHADNTNPSAPSAVEIGVVEKLLNGYGFIKCYNREQLLFFNQPYYYQGPVNGLKPGDIVEFEPVVDKRTGKTIATNLIKHQDKVNQKRLQQQQQQQQPKLPPEPFTQSDVANINLTSLKEIIMKSNQMAPENAASGRRHSPPTSSGSGSNTTSSNPSLTSLPSYMQGLNLNPGPVNGSSLSNQQQNYQQLMNDLQSMQQQHRRQNQEDVQAAVMNMNSIMSMFNNKEPAASGSNQFLNAVAAAVASNSKLTKSNSNLVDMVSNETVDGSVSVASSMNTLYNGGGADVASRLDGRIEYKRNGETFHIPYSVSDVCKNVPLKESDRVRFNIAQDSQTGTCYACQINLVEEPARVYRGVISVLRDSFGKIEREDVYKETLFHLTEYKDSSQPPQVGLNVEFEIESRYGKEIATNIRSLPAGTVNFDELSDQVFVGRITKTPSPAAMGHLIYECEEKLVELSFGEKDHAPNAGSYLLLEGDFVHFRIATDKRRKNASARPMTIVGKPRATQLTLIEGYSLRDNSVNTNEHRENGILVEYDPASGGFIKCVEREELVYFSVGELIRFVSFVPVEEQGSTQINPEAKEVSLEAGDSLEFSVIRCPKDGGRFKTGNKAVRVVKLARDSVKFEHVSEEVFSGYVEKEPVVSDDKSYGYIRYEYPGGVEPVRIPFSYKNQQCDETESAPSTGPKQVYYNGDKVQFNVLSCLKSNTQYAVNVRLAEARKEMGYITMLKDNYGFIELDVLFDAGIPQTTNKLPKDIFFHYSSVVQGPASGLEIGDLVEFAINRKAKQKLSAENVVKLVGRGAKKFKKVATGPKLKGKVIQTLRSHSTNANGQDQSDDTYYGKVQLIADEQKSDSTPDSASTYYYGLFSLIDKKANLQMGDLVTFQLIDCRDGTQKAFNVGLVQGQEAQQQPQQQAQASGGKKRDPLKGKIESLKGHSGFIEYSLNNETRKIFFHISDLLETSESNGLKAGDEVEFVVSHGSRNGKQAAIKIKKIRSASPSSSTTAACNQAAAGSSSSESSSAPGEDSAASKRPERLNLKIKNANVDDDGKQLVLIRQPVNPDAKTLVASFSRERRTREPGSRFD